jgi:hypothetical protein
MWMVVGALAVVGVVIGLLVRSGPVDTVAHEPALTSILIVSNPPGSSVVWPDGGVLGVTPFTASLPRLESEVPVIVTHEGYNDRRTTLPLFSQTGRVDVTLTAIGADAAAPPKLPKDWKP